MLRIVFRLVWAALTLALTVMPVAAQAQSNASAYDVDTGIRTEEFAHLNTKVSADFDLYVSPDGWYSFMVPKGAEHIDSAAGTTIFTFDNMTFIIDIKTNASFANHTPAQLDSEVDYFMTPASAIYGLATQIGTIVSSEAIHLKTDNPALKAPKLAAIDVRGNAEGGSDETVVMALPSNRGVMIIVCTGTYKQCREYTAEILRLGYAAFVPAGQPVTLDKNGKLSGPK